MFLQAKQDHIAVEGHMSPTAFRQTYHFNEDTKLTCSNEIVREPISICLQKLAKPAPSIALRKNEALPHHCIFIVNPCANDLPWTLQCSNCLLKK